VQRNDALLTAGGHNAALYQTMADEKAGITGIAVPEEDVALAQNDRLGLAQKMSSDGRRKFMQQTVGVGKARRRHRRPFVRDDHDDSPGKAMGRRARWFDTQGQATSMMLSSADRLKPLRRSGRASTRYAFTDL
jgi:hypothetical protein